MNFKLTTPCDTCPFRWDVPGFLMGERAEEIAFALLHQDQTFACHKTVKYDDDGAVERGPQEHHCAGALILAELSEAPNQMMRIMERIGGYDARKLRYDTPVFECEEDFIEHHAESSPPRDDYERTLLRPSWLESAE